MEQHAAFSSLPIPSARGGGRDALGRQVQDLSMRRELFAEPASSQEFATAKKAFDFARQVLRKNEEWKRQQEAEKKDRKERDELMEISCDTSTTPPTLRRSLSGSSEGAIDSLKKISMELSSLAQRAEVISEQFQSGKLASGQAVTQLSNVEAEAKIFDSKIDSIYTGELTSGKDKAKSLKKELNKNIEELNRRFEDLFKKFKSSNEDAHRMSVDASSVGTPCDKITIIMGFPDGKEDRCSFNPRDSGFEVYAKAFQLGGEKQPSELRLMDESIGCNTSKPSSVNRLLDESVWGMTLIDLGMVGGRAYYLNVKH